MKTIASPVIAVALAFGTLSGIGVAASSASAAQNQKVLTTPGVSIASRGEPQTMARPGIQLAQHYDRRRYYSRRCYVIGYRTYFSPRLGWIRKPIYRCFYRRH